MSQELDNYVMRVGHSIRMVHSFKEASEAYVTLRDEADGTMRNWPQGDVLLDGITVARISYNGRVWEPEIWSPTSKLLYDPYEKFNHEADAKINAMLTEAGITVPGDPS